MNEDEYLEEMARKYVERHTTHIKGYTEEYVNKLQHKYDNLQSNWNSLREYVEELYNKEGSWAGCGARYVLDKMNKLEGVTDE